MCRDGTAKKPLDDGKKSWQKGRFVRSAPSDEHSFRGRSGRAIKRSDNERQMRSECKSSDRWLAGSRGEFPLTMALRNERSKYVTNKRTKVPVAVGHGKMVVDGMGVGNYLGFVGQEVEPCRAGPSAAAASTRCAHAAHTHQPASTSDVSDHLPLEKRCRSSAWAVTAAALFCCCPVSCVLRQRPAWLLLLQKRVNVGWAASLRARRS